MVNRKVYLTPIKFFFVMCMLIFPLKIVTDPNF